MQACPYSYLRGACAKSSCNLLCFCVQWILPRPTALLKTVTLCLDSSGFQRCVARTLLSKFKQQPATWAYSCCPLWLSLQNGTSVIKLVPLQCSASDKPLCTSSSWSKHSRVMNMSQPYSLNDQTACSMMCLCFTLASCLSALKYHSC